VAALEKIVWKLPQNPQLGAWGRERRASGRNPSLGKIFWLVNSDRGNEVARQLLDRGDPRP
jgi:hypothetical protein